MTKAVSKVVIFIKSFHAVNKSLIEVSNHRRRMETEGKNANVVTSVWRQNLFNSLPRLLFYLGLFGRNGFIQPFLQMDRLNSTVSSKKTQAKQLALQGIEQILPPKQTWRPLPCLLFPSFFCASNGTHYTAHGTVWSESCLFLVRVQTPELQLLLVQGSAHVRRVVQLTRPEIMLSVGLSPGVRIPKRWTITI